MIKNSINYFIALFVILLITNPIVISKFNIKEDDNNYSLFLKEQRTKEIYDQKITQAIEMVNESLLRQFLEEILINGPRKTGTYGCDQAAEFIFNQFQEMGLETRYQYWKSRNDRKPFKLFKSQNVEGVHKNNNTENKEILVFNAHYDSSVISPGANDDGSGVAAVLTAAYVLSSFEFNRTIKFVTFSGEEVGLLGSKNYVKEIYEKNEDILIEFNADMIGYAKTTQGGKNVSLSSTEDAKWIIDEIKNVNQIYNINFNIKQGWKITPGGPRSGSDYHDFVLYGYEAIAFWEDEFERSYFHTPNDTIDHINFSYLVNVTKLIVGSLAYLADFEVTYPRIRIVTPKHGRLYYEDRTIRKFRFDKTKVIDDVLIHTYVKQGDSPIKYVEFYYKGKKVFNDTEAPYQYRINNFSIRKHSIRVVVYDEKGRYASDELKFYFFNIFKRR
jgi:aminopeptidase YwaD